MKDWFWRKNEGVLQKNGGVRKIILRILSHFSHFFAFHPLQVVDLQLTAAIQPLQKKIVPKILP
jgi:hypothetical protein